MGGVGNQLFQIARACSHRENGHDVCLIHLTRYKKSIYRLAGFTDHDDWINIDNVANNLGIKIKEASYSQMFILMLLFTLKRLGVNRYFDAEINKTPSIHKKYIDVGYYQSKKHITLNSIKEVSYALIELLDLSSHAPSSGIVLHIRGGDFPERWLIEMDSIQKMKDLAKRRREKLKIVTNDKKFALTFFNSKDDISVNNSSSARADFIFLSRSNVLFLSNSSFAFWAATIAAITNDAELFGTDSFLWNDLIDLDNINLS